MQIRHIPAKSYRAIFKWGARDVFYTLDERLKTFIVEKLGLSREEVESPHLPGLDELTDVPPSKLTDKKVKALGELVGPENVSTESFSRAKHGYGSTFYDLLRLRQGVVKSAPDAVVAPKDEKDCEKVLAFCQEEGIPVIPAGARSSVTRGVEAPTGGVCLDLTRHMNQILEVNPEDLSARVQPGIYGPAYEEELNSLGFTGGHFPQSFEFSTVGGWVATRGAGQQSTYYGKAEDLVLALRCATPQGLLATLPFPKAALGPDMNQLLVGSEGSYGVLTEATMKIFPHYKKGQLPICFMFRTFEEGLSALREILQGGFGKPGVFRLSDPEETEVALELDGLSGGTLDKTLKRLGYKSQSRSLFIAATDGDPTTAAYTAARAHAVGLRHRGLPLGGLPLHAWKKRRYHDPYLRDDLMDMGVITDTLETAVTWSGMKDLWSRVRKVMKKRPRTVVMTHISHAYENGGNLYFIFLSPMKKGKEIEDYSRFHKEIVDAIVANGGSLSHHHGIGRLFAPWLPAHLGSLAHRTLDSVKKNLDPKGVMNPGVLGLPIEG